MFYFTVVDSTQVSWGPSSEVEANASTVTDINQLSFIMPLIGSYIQELCLFKVGAEVLLCSPGYSQTTEVKWSSCLIFPICCYKYVPGSVNVSEGLL